MPITLDEIKVGMALVNDSTSPLNVYGSFNTNDPPLLVVQPGGIIGTVLNERTENGVNWVMVQSSAIDAASPWYDKLYDSVSQIPVLNIINDWFIGDIKNAGAVKVDDLLNAVSQAQIDKLNGVLTTMNATNPSVTKDLITAVKKGGDVLQEAEGAVMKPVLIALAIYFGFRLISSPAQFQPSKWQLKSKKR